MNECKFQMNAAYFLSSIIRTEDKYPKSRNMLRLHVQIELCCQRPLVPKRAIALCSIFSILTY